MLYPVLAMTTHHTSSSRAVLVVDDDIVIADTLAEVLNHAGFPAHAAYDGESAIEAALLSPPRLVISDVMMPGVNGIDLGISIRRIFPDCKVILLSGVAASSDLIATALSAGNHFVFLEKPVRPEVLLKHVEESLNPR